jgi:hypothetical protein
MRNNGFTVNESICIPSLSLVGQSLVVCYDAIYSGYSINKKLQNTLAQSHITSNTFFDFISGFNFKDKTQNGLFTLVGILLSYSLDLDTSWLYTGYMDNPQILDDPKSKFGLMDAVRNTSNESKIFTFLRRAMSGFESFIQTPFEDLESQSETSFRRLFVSFLVALRRQYNLVFDEDSIRILSATLGEQEQGLLTYLSASNIKDVSTEAINEFKNSVFSEFSELHIGNRIASEQIDIDSDIQNRDIASLKENLKAMRSHDASITGPAPLKDAANDAGESNTGSATGKELDQALDSMPIDDSTESGRTNAKAADQGNESGDVGATDDDDTSGTKSDKGEDESADEGKDDTNKSDDKKKDDQRDKISMHPVPDLPDVSDKEGVKLELTSSETTDTVFYRIELKSYIDSVLNNPPKTISQQKIQVLKKIEAYWLNILTPQCLYDLINTVIKLPREFEIHNKGKQK